MTDDDGNRNYDILWLFRCPNSLLKFKILAFSSPTKRGIADCHVPSFSGLVIKAVALKRALKLAWKQGHCFGRLGKRATLLNRLHHWTLDAHRYYVVDWCHCSFTVKAQGEKTVFPKPHFLWKTVHKRASWPCRFFSQKVVCTIDQCLSRDGFRTFHRLF